MTYLSKVWLIVFDSSQCSKIRTFSPILIFAPSPKIWPWKFTIKGIKFEFSRHEYLFSFIISARKFKLYSLQSEFSWWNFRFWCENQNRRKSADFRTLWAVGLQLQTEKFFDRRCRPGKGHLPLDQQITAGPPHFMINFNASPVIGSLKKRF